MPLGYYYHRNPSDTTPKATNTSTTAKLSPTLLQRSGLTFAEGVKGPAASNTSPPSQRTVSSPGGVRPRISFPELTSITTSPPCVQKAEEKMNSANNAKEQRRRRRSSSLMYQEPPESLEQLSDQRVVPNLNAQWVNAKGAWLIHPLLILFLKLCFSLHPSISVETSWTLTNLAYMSLTYLMFHYVRGVPFEFNAGAYDNLNLWEQIDNGAQYTPAKKFLLGVPVALFLVSTHYTRYDLKLFLVNFFATVGVVVPKLPALHRMRFALFSDAPEPPSR